MFNSDYIAKGEIKKNIIQICQKIPDHPYRIIIVGGSDLEKRMHCLI